MQLPHKAYPLIRLSRAPYAGSAARAGLDVALSFAVFAQAPEVLLTGPAVLGLLPWSSKPERAAPSMRKVLDSLPLYDVERIWIDEDSLEEHAVRQSTLPDYANVLDTDGVRHLLARAKHILSL